MKQVIIIPARLNSLRLPKKVLLDIHGLPMIEHVRRRTLLAKKVSEVFVATCDEEINQTILSFGGKVIMTNPDHQNGTSRASEAVKKINCENVILVQGDEPLILPDQIDHFIEGMNIKSKYKMWNAVTSLKSESDLDNISQVKCSIINSDIIYFFRKSPSNKLFDEKKKYIKKVLGLIGFQKSFLNEFAKSNSTLIEKIESIEQMRAIEIGERVCSIELEKNFPSINEEKDFYEVLRVLEKSNLQKEILKKYLK
tara:strand:- start:8000 stop:8761 length:762 start_codon:yes stop_codon:yes gene_type:complete